MSTLNTLKNCRICGNSNLVSVLDLGNQALTGRFPKDKAEPLARLPLELVKCTEQNGSPSNSVCGLLQLKHTGDLSEFYGKHYGYRSGLNGSMVRHLHGKVKTILAQADLKPGDLVVDIGANDSTTLQAYPQNLRLLGVDPTGAYFKSYYPAHIELIADFFSSDKVLSYTQGKRAAVITSFSMFYDLEDPLAFMKQIQATLAPEGIWVFEQSYMPTMLDMISYDTVCHEHLEYYGLSQIQWMATRAGLKILDVEFNAVNGGSFSVTAALQSSNRKANTPQVEKVLQQEKERGLDTLKPFDEFRKNTEDHRVAMRKFLDQAKKEGRKVFGYGASTKGNVMLQYCNVTTSDVPAIAEVNADKFGSFTPGTLIPIISEAQAKEMKPDYFMVLPWHFRNHILERETEFRKSGGKFLFPFPKMEII